MVSVLVSQRENQESQKRKQENQESLENQRNKYEYNDYNRTNYYMKTVIFVWTLDWMHSIYDAKQNYFGIGDSKRDGSNI